ncbi:MAG TPA: glutamine-hydrolyzing GMP synthase [Bacteroidetes bacterium]|nr:glutamine-hydrolyzing GMP synthase [Bacteroidota bacterium]
MEHSEWILVLDFGSQYTQLIARRIRECGVYSEIKPFNYAVDQIKKNPPSGMILSGGPFSVYHEKAPLSDPGIFRLGIPVLGICYGLQLIAFQLDGQVDPAAKREYGRAKLHVMDAAGLFKNIPDSSVVWMSHGDHLTKLPQGFRVIARTDNAPIAAIGNKAARIFGIQFHPEVIHTEHGVKIVDNFLMEVCRLKKLWSPQSFLENTIVNLRKKIGAEKVICGVSGGVDSTVVAELLHRAVGDRLKVIFIDNGLLRLDESVWVRRMFEQKLHILPHFVDGSALFLEKLHGVVNPEKKRKIIGEVFIRLFEEEAKQFDDAAFLAQGTLYPDVIESQSAVGPSAQIKSHHNVGGLPDWMKLDLIEPLRELFKDEVRKIGKLLDIPGEMLNRHPFPGPGLAVRVIGEITGNRLKIVRFADAIFMEELQRSGWYDRVWQAFAVLLPVKSVGVMGDERTYENVIALRSVTSLDGMTADWGKLPYDLLGVVSNRIINEVKGVNRVVYDVSSKPPSTIEWE